MRFSKVKLITEKDFKIFSKKRSIIYTIIFFEVVVSVAMPFIIRFAVLKHTDLAATIMPALINSFSFWFVIGAGVLPISIASYSLVGEKIQKSLEPLLATPVSDDEILAGKSLAAFLPAIVANFIGAIIFMVLIDIFTHPILNYLFYPNLPIILIVLVLAPLAGAFSVGVNVLVSSRINDVRTAQQMGSFAVVPLIAIYILSEITLFTISVSSILIIAAVLLVADLIVFYLVKSTFNRNQILTKWR